MADKLSGFVKLHRKLIEWGWYSDCVVKDVFIHLLMVACWKEGEYLGHKLSPGDAVVGRKKLAAELGFSEQQIRTALHKLESTGEISLKSTNRFTIATVANWAVYQGDDDGVNQQITNKQPTDNQQITNKQPHLKKVKKVRKKEYIYNNSLDKENLNGMKDNNNKKNIYIGVPDEILEPFMEWVEMRKKIKKPVLTERTVNTAISKLKKLSQDTNKQIELINLATDNCWLSFYPPKEEEKKKYDFG